MQKENSKIRIYNAKDSIVFGKTDGPFGGLSNMAPGYPLFINDNIVPTAEALYQAMRYPLFPDIQHEIIIQNSPMTAKMISKKYRDKTRQDWDDIRVKIMRWVLEVKLSQNWTKFSTLLKLLIVGILFNVLIISKLYKELPLVVMLNRIVRKYY